MKKKLPLELEALLACFPPIDPPITLSQEVAYRFSRDNKPLPQALISTYFAQWDKMDDYTEVVPCCQLATDGDFYAIIYWKGSLMSYEYILATISPQAQLINKKVIAGTISNGTTVKSSVATIDEESCVYTMVGELKEGQLYDPSNSSGYRFEVLPDGTIQNT